MVVKKEFLRYDEWYKKPICKSTGKSQNDIFLEWMEVVIAIVIIIINNDNKNPTKNSVALVFLV